MKSNHSSRTFLWLVLLACFWGPSFLFIKVAVTEIPPITLVLGRVSLGAVLLYATLRLQGRNLPAWGGVWRHLAVVAFFHTAFPFVLFSWGEQYISSALASILNGTTPLFTILLAHLFVVDDHLTPTKLMGTLLGFGGLLLLIAPSFLNGFEATTWGLLAVTTAAACYAIAIVYARNHLRGLPPLVAPTGQLLLSAVWLLPLSLLLDRPYQLPLPSLPALGSLLALAVLGTALAFWVYYRLLETADPSYIAMVTYLLPVIGVILGVVVLHERLDWHTYAGSALILLGVMTVNGVFKNINLQRLRWGYDYK